MWWREISALQVSTAQAVRRFPYGIHAKAKVDPGAVLDESHGQVAIGPGTLVCAGAIIRGPVIIGADCLIGNNAFVRGPSKIGNRVKVGYSTELKQVLIGNDVTIGPLCFVADSRVDPGSYLGAMVRTSNHRLDGRNIAVRDGNLTVETGLEKLGCWIGEKSSLGIMVIVLPGRVVAPRTLIEPRITISKNLPAGHYRLIQTLEAADRKPNHEIEYI